MSAFLKSKSNQQQQTKTLVRECIIHWQFTLAGEEDDVLLRRAVKEWLKSHRSPLFQTTKLTVDGESQSRVIRRLRNRKSKGNAIVKSLKLNE